MIGEIDQDGNGCITFNEFVTLMTNVYFYILLQSHSDLVILILSNHLRDNKLISSFGKETAISVFGVINS